MKTKPTARKTSTKLSASAEPAAKLDLGKIFRAEYLAPRKPVVLDTAPARYLAIEGTGAPGGDVFQARIGALYSIAFTVKMTRKFSGEQDYSISRLEARYMNLNSAVEASTPRGRERERVDFASAAESRLNLGDAPLPPAHQWRWQLFIRTPEFVAADELVRAVAALRKRGKEGEAALVHLESIAEGRCVQMLHVGPYDKECDTVATMKQLAAARGLRFAGPHHEIYISDPRRVAPAKLKTILRFPVVPV